MAPQHESLLAPVTDFRQLISLWERNKPRNAKIRASLKSIVLLSGIMIFLFFNNPLMHDIKKEL